MNIHCSFISADESLLVVHLNRIQNWNKLQVIYIITGDITSTITVYLFGYGRDAEFDTV